MLSVSGSGSHVPPTADRVVSLMVSRTARERIIARVVYSGAGVRLRGSAKPQAIRAAVERVIREPGFRAAAARIGATITADAAAQRGLDELEALASD